MKVNRNEVERIYRKLHEGLLEKNDTTIENITDSNKENIQPNITNSEFVKTLNALK